MTKEEALHFLRNVGPTICPAQLARILGGKPYSYYLAAKNGELGLPYVWRGKNLRIFTDPIITILEGGNPNDLNRTRSQERG